MYNNIDNNDYEFFTHSINNDPIFGYPFLNTIITDNVLLEFDDCRVYITFIDMDTDKEVNINIEKCSFELEEFTSIFYNILYKFMNNEDSEPILCGDIYDKNENKENDIRAKIETDIGNNVIRLTDYYSNNIIEIHKDDIDLKYIKERLDELNKIIEEWTNS